MNFSWNFTQIFTKFLVNSRNLWRHHIVHSCSCCHVRSFQRIIYVSSKYGKVLSKPEKKIEKNFVKSLNFRKIIRKTYLSLFLVNKLRSTPSMRFLNHVAILDCFDAGWDWMIWKTRKNFMKSWNFVKNFVKLLTWSRRLSK